MITFVGLAIISAIFAVGVYQIVRNVAWKRTPDRYEYSVDEDGNEIVKEKSDA